MRLPNHLDCSMEVLFAKAFLSTPGSTRGFVKPKGSNEQPLQKKFAMAVLLFLGHTIAEPSPDPDEKAQKKAEKAFD